MGLFSTLFNSSKPKKIVETQLGPFTLVYSKRGKNTWSHAQEERVMTVQGSENEPDSIQVNFLESIDSEIQKLDSAITERFINEFKEADLEINFTNWKDQFKIVATEVMLIFQGETYWNITFEDTKEPYFHFTLYIEGKKTTDFSIDT